MSLPLWQRPAGELAAALADGGLTAVELLEACLERCARVNRALNALVTPTFETAREEARAADARRREGRRLSVLDGIPITVKDNLYLRGVRATWGSLLFADFVPDQDDLFAERLRAAGAVVIGKTNTPEFAMAGYTDNRLFGVTRNPWNLALTPGGSSGGATACVASGMAPLAVGTDAGGSIRTPASYTGVVGLRPSTNRIARRHGFLPMAHDFQVIAPLARTVADVRLLYDVLAGPDPRDPGSLRFAGAAAQPARDALRIRVVMDVDNEPIDPEVRAHVRAAARTLGDLGYRIEEGGPPYDLEAVRAVYATFTAAGAARVVAGRDGWRARVSDNVAAMAEQGLKLTATDYVLAVDRLTGIRAAISEAWKDFDVIVTPTAATLPWPLHRPYPATIDGRPAHARSASIFTTWVNAAGYPAVSVPVAPSASGLPIGMQIVGRFGADDLILDIAQRFERAQPWTSRWPALAHDAGAA